jgi:hypothetical protein
MPGASATDPSGDSWSEFSALARGGAPGGPLHPTPAWIGTFFVRQWGRRRNVGASWARQGRGSTGDRVGVRAAQRRRSTLRFAHRTLRHGAISVAGHRPATDACPGRSLIGASAMASGAGASTGPSPMASASASTGPSEAIASAAASSLSNVSTGTLAHATEATAHPANTTRITRDHPVRGRLHFAA